MNHHQLKKEINRNLIDDFVDKEYLTQKKIIGLKKEFKTNKPFPYVVVERFFKEGKLREVFEALKRESFERRDTDLYQFKQTKDLALARNAVLKEFYDFLNSRELDLVFEKKFSTKIFFWLLMFLLLLCLRFYPHGMLLLVV